jgi:hypothetical protein
MSPKKKQCLPVLPGQKTLFSFVGRDENNNFDPDDSMRKETEKSHVIGCYSFPVVRHFIIYLLQR